jgi:hypothetical protein
LAASLVVLVPEPVAPDDPPMFGQLGLSWL